MATSSTSSTTSTSYNRLTGLATGLDTDSMVKSLMKAEKVPYNKLAQQRQLVTWRQEAYRDVTSILRGLKDDYFNVTKPATNMLSQNTYAKMTSASTDTSIVTAVGTAEATEGAHVVHVTQVATAGKAASAAALTKTLGGTVSNFSLSGKTMKLTLDGVTREISMDNYTSGASSDIVSKASTGLQALVDGAFGAGKVTVAYDSATSAVSFSTAGGASKLALATGSSNDGLAALGISNGASNRITTTDTLAVLESKMNNSFGAVGGKVAFKINGTSFEFSTSDSLSKVMTTVNADTTAGVTMAYDEASDKITLTAKQMGAGNSIAISNTTGTFFGTTGATGIDTVTPVSVANQGKDAILTVDGVSLTRSSNTFTYNGVRYTLNSAHTTVGDTDTINLTRDVDTVFNNIKTFVDKYNEAVDKINTKLSDKYDRNYQPLTDEQKADMQTEDITKWETKAKTGLLRNDSILQNALSDMRRALNDSVSGVSGSLAQIGITTGTYSDKGKLTIDETKLKAAISSSPDTVMKLFTAKSDVAYSDTMTQSQKTERYNENGFMQRIADVLDKNIKTTGVKGLLLQKAGVTGDLTEYTSSLSKQGYDYDTRLTALYEKLSDKETAYYNKFAKLETAINKMNSQSSWLKSQTGG